MNLPASEAMDLLLMGVIDGKIGVEHLTTDQLLELELHLMDCLAVKAAGNEYLVHWQTENTQHGYH